MVDWWGIWRYVEVWKIVIQVDKEYMIISNDIFMQEIKQLAWKTFN